MSKMEALKVCYLTEPMKTMNIYINQRCRLKYQKQLLKLKTKRAKTKQNQFHIDKLAKGPFSNKNVR